MRRLLTWYDAHRGGRTVLVGWIVTRALMLVIFGLRESFVVGDVVYYWRKIHALFDVGLASTLNEYPTPVVWLLWLPYGITGGTKLGYEIAFIVLMLALDAVFTLAIYRAAGRRRDPASDFWIGFVFLVGPLTYLRFDVLPAVLAGGALLAMRRRPWLSGALTGLGAAMKLWPALLYPAFLAFRGSGDHGVRRPRPPLSYGFLAVGVGLAALSLIFGGWSRLVSPLTWQSGRGLQIESVWATPLMVARIFDSAGWSVRMSQFQAYEVFGSGVTPSLWISNVATVAGLVMIIALFVRAFRNPAPRLVGIGLVLLATVAIMIVTNKTLSPQYLLWLGGAMAAVLLLRAEATAAEHRLLRRLALQLLVLALLTHLVYPLFYDGLLDQKGEPLLISATIVTALRNVALLAFTVEVCRLAWTFLAPSEAAVAAEPARS